MFILTLAKYFLILRVRFEGRTANKIANGFDRWPATWSYIVQFRLPIVFVSMKEKAKVNISEPSPSVNLYNPLNMKMVI